jgi:transcriptional regulator with XRE-family HTH domain
MAKLQTVKLGNSEYVILPKAEYLQLQKSAGAPPDAVDAVAYASGSLAQPLTAARQQAGLTQAELAKRLGKSQPLISGTENGSVSISERYVSAVLKACGLPSDWKGPARQKSAPQGSEEPRSDNHLRITHPLRFARRQRTDRVANRELNRLTGSSAGSMPPGSNRRPGARRQVDWPNSARTECSSSVGP